MLERTWMLSVLIYRQNATSELLEKKYYNLLFYPDATCHSISKLSDIKLQFLPVNTATMMQPTDHGVFKLVKTI